MYKNYSDIGAQVDGQYDQYSVKEIEDESDKNRLLSENRILCVDVYADWCEPCKLIAPDYAMLASKYNGSGIALVKEKIDKNLSPNINVIPIFDFYIDGKLIPEHRLVGGDVQAVDKKIKELLQSASRPRETQTKGPQFSRSSIRSRSSLYQNPSGPSDPGSSSSSSSSSSSGAGSSYSPYQQYKY